MLNRQLEAIEREVAKIELEEKRNYQALRESLKQYEFQEWSSLDASQIWKSLLEITHTSYQLEDPGLIKMYAEPIIIRMKEYLGKNARNPDQRIRDIFIQFLDKRRQSLGSNQEERQLGEYYSVLKEVINQ